MCKIGLPLVPKEPARERCRWQMQRPQRYTKCRRGSELAVTAGLQPLQQSWMENSTGLCPRTPGQGRQFKNSSISQPSAASSPSQGSLCGRPFRPPLQARFQAFRRGGMYGRPCREAPLTAKASPHNCVCGLRPIFRPIRAGIKGGNTYSIPALLSLSYEAKSLAECACQIVRCCPNFIAQFSSNCRADRESLRTIGCRRGICHLLPPS